jgi:hypothetical protein
MLSVGSFNLVARDWVSNVFFCVCKWGVAPPPKYWCTVRPVLHLYACARLRITLAACGSELIGFLVRNENGFVS